MGPEIDPWLVPIDDKLGCSILQSPEIFNVPTKTKAGISFYKYYDFTITPDTMMFYGKKKKKVHQVISPFNTAHFDITMNIIAEEMEEILLPGFDERDCCDPVAGFKNIKRVGLPIVMSMKRNNQ